MQRQRRTRQPLFTPPGRYPFSFVVRSHRRTVSAETRISAAWFTGLARQEMKHCPVCCPGGSLDAAVEMRAVEHYLATDEVVSSIRAPPRSATDRRISAIPPRQLRLEYYASFLKTGLRYAGKGVAGGFPCPNI